MDLWATLGIAPEVGLLLAAGGVVAALLLGIVLLSRRSRAGRSDFDLGQPR